jgi:hypothetical protein
LSATEVLKLTTGEETEPGVENTVSNNEATSGEKKSVAENKQKMKILEDRRQKVAVESSSSQIQSISTAGMHGGAVCLSATQILKLTAGEVPDEYMNDVFNSEATAIAENKQHSKILEVRQTAAVESSKSITAGLHQGEAGSCSTDFPSLVRHTHIEQQPGAIRVSGVNSSNDADLTYHSDEDEIEGQGSSNEIFMTTAMTRCDLEQEVRDQVKKEAIPAIVVHEVGLPWFNLILAIGCCIVVVVAAITIGAVVARKNSSTEDVVTDVLVPSENCKSDDGLDSIEYLKQTLYPLLNQEDSLTILEIEKEGTPQSKAFIHLSNDPNVICYTTDRVLQRFALTTFYFSTNGDWWYNNTGWLAYEEDECNWFSQHRENPEFPVCDQHGVYRWLVMTKNNVTGEIPLEVQYLEKLEALDLFSNNIESANLEAIINRMEHLLILNLYDNELKLNMDELPASFRPGRRLEELYVGNNRLYGSYPEAFGSLFNLNFLLLDLNKNLVGHIPESYCELQKLRKFAPIAD